MPTSAAKPQTSPFDYTATWALFSDDIRIFPVNAFTKRPLLKGWPDLATDQSAQIDVWSKQSPHAMVGVLCGRDTDLFVLDLDKRKRTDGKEPLDGHVELIKLEEKWGPLPSGPRSQTPGGGVHIPFRYPSGVRIRNGVSQVAPGIDVRSDRGFVIYPGSVRSDGRAYEWLEGNAFDVRPYAPNWLIFLVLFNKRKRKRLAKVGINSHEDLKSDNPALWNDEIRELMRPKARRPADYALTDRRKKEFINYVEGGIEGELKEVRAATEGVRDHTLNKAAISIWSLLLGAEEQGVDISELEADVFWRLVQEALGMGEEFDEDCVRDKWDRCRDDADPRNLWHVGTPDAKIENEDIIGDDVDDDEPLFERDMTYLVNKEPTREPFVIERWKPRGYVTALSGDAGTNKSTMLLMAAVCIGAGKPFYGYAVEQGEVIGLLREDSENQLNRRLRAACKHLDVEFAEVMKNLRLETFAERDEVFLWCDKASGNLPAGETKFAKRVVAAISQHPKAKLLILDSNVDIYDGNEVDRRAASKFMAWLSRVAMQHQIAITVVFHESKSAGDKDAHAVSGTTGFRYKAKSQMRIVTDSNDGNKRVLKHTKHSYSPKAPDMSLQFQDDVLVSLNDDWQRNSECYEVARGLILPALKKRTNLSPNSTAKNYIVRWLHKNQGSHSFTEPEFKSAVEQLCDVVLMVEKYKISSGTAERYALQPETFDDFD